MKTIGVIAEYNPFHEGHRQMLQIAKEQTGAQRAVIVMSGNSVQRGDFAIVDSFARARTAVQNGADLVLELSYCYASQSAEYFARGAVDLLNSLGIVDYLCFGSESNDSATLQSIAKLLVDQRDEIHARIDYALRRGSSYPAARQQAILSLAPKEAHRAVLSAPNDILGIEYVKALYKTNSRMQPFVIRRIGAEHHSTDFEQSVPSASAIRKMLIENNLFSQKLDLLSYNPVDLKTELENLHRFELRALEIVMPKELAQHMLELKRANMLQSIEHYLPALKAMILTRGDELSEIFEVREGIENALRRNVRSATSVASLAQAVKSKRYTYTRIQRILLNILIGLTKTDMQTIKESPVAPSSRILAFNETGRRMLKEIKEHEQATLINKPAAFVPECPLHKLQRKYDERVDALYYMQYRYDQNGHRIFDRNETSPLYIP